MKKLKKKKGFTLIEMLACTVTLLLIALICTTGTNLALRSYEESVLESNIQNLEATIDLYIGDILRYATDVKPYDGTDEVEELTNASYQIYKGMIEINQDGHLVCTSIHNNGKKTLLVGKNTYAEMLYIESFELHYDAATKLFEGNYVIGNTLNETKRTCEFAYRMVAQ